MRTLVFYTVGRNLQITPFKETFTLYQIYQSELLLPIPKYSL